MHQLSCILLNTAFLIYGSAVSQLPPFLLMITFNFCLKNLIIKHYLANASEQMIQAIHPNFYKKFNSAIEYS